MKHQLSIDESHHRYKCTHTGCLEVFHKKMQLIEHQKKEHDVTYQEVKLNFNSMEDFNSWKEKEEVQNHVYFSRQYGETKTSSSKHQYYFCQHDGPIHTHRKYGEPARKTNRKFRRGSIKTGKFCPARITVTENIETGNIIVHYNRTHIHPISIENTKFQPMPKTLRDDVKAKISLGVPVEDIYKDIRNDLGSRNERGKGTITKAHLIQKSTISDMKRNLKNRRRLHPDDSTSTFLLVKKFQTTENYNPIIVYKPQGRNVEIGPTVYNDMDINKDLFVLGIQTKPQLDMFIKGSTKVVCIDSTHKTNQYGFPLTNIVVPDEFGKGYPVAHLISNHADELTLRPFLEEIKSRCPADLKINCIMTDDDNSGWNAITSIFGESKHLLCRWHIHRSFRRKLNLAPKTIQNELFEDLLVLSGERDQHEFAELLDGFIQKYTLKAPQFLKYLSDNYFNRCEKWAMCYRNFEHANTDTNMYVESFHNRLKTFFMNRKINKRVDDLVLKLLEIEEEDYWR